MDMKRIPVPQVYKDSQDFRFFMDWFATALSKIQYDISSMPDLYDPLRIRDDLLWMLADTMGYKLDDRLPIAFNRLVLIYFMSMIYNRGSRDGVALAASVNLAQFAIQQNALEDDVYYNRLEDPSIPVNAVYVNTNVEAGYIDVVYFSESEPLDACIEYVRPLGMFCFQHSGVRVDTDMKISIDARLTDMKDIGMSFGPAQVGRYRREDYARMQKTITPTENDESFKRNPVYYRNSIAEGETNPNINPGYRALYSLQLSNNDNIVKSLVPIIFGLGYRPQPSEVMPWFPDDYLTNSKLDPKSWNLRYDLTTDEENTPQGDSEYDVSTIENAHYSGAPNPVPRVNPIMSELGDAMSE